MSFDHVRRDALDLLANACAALQRVERNPEADLVRDARNQLLDGRVTAAVIGEYKRGKSSLIGALVEDPDLFPVNVDIATNLVTSIEYGVTEQITVFVGDPGAAPPQPIGRAQIPEYVTEQGNAGNHRDSRLLRIRTPSPRLKAGLVLLDTPGAGGVNTEHTAVTYAVLGSVDVAIFVIDALTPMSVDELSLLETVAGLEAHLLVVITKIDKVADHQAVVSNATVKLAGLLGEELAGRTPVIPVSSIAKIDWLRDGDPESLAVSNFERLDTALWGLLGDHGGAMLVTRAMARLVRVLDDVSAPMSAELVALTAGESEVREAAARVHEQRDRLVTLERADSGWRSSLVGAFNGIRFAIDAQLGHSLDEVSSRVEVQLKDPNVTDHREALLATVERDVTLVWSGLVRDVRLEIARISDAIESMTGLQVNPVLKQGGALTAFESFGRKERPPEDSAGSGYETLGWVGEVLGYLLGNVPVFLVSRVVSVLGVRSAKTKKRRDDFAADVRDQLSRVRRELGVAAADLVDSAETSVTSSYEALIRDGRGRVEEVGHALTVVPGDAGRIEHLTDALVELRDLRASAVEITARATGRGPETAVEA